MLLDIYHHALKFVSGQTRVANFLNNHPITGHVYAVAIGKAAESMMQGAKQALGVQLVSGLVITKQGYETGVFDHDAVIETVVSSHPVPDETSLAAGQRLIEFIQSVPKDSHCLILISGGTSSLVEVLPEDVMLDDLRRMTEWALGNALPIQRINRLRKSLSCIKGGRLAGYLAGKKATQLLISDVAGDDPAVIGSGLLVPDTQIDGEVDLPEWLQVLIDRVADAPNGAPKSDETVFNDIDTHVVATLTDALNAAADKAYELGYTVHLDLCPLTGDVLEVADRITDQVLVGPAGVYIFGGEPTVTLPDVPGRGGRMQHLALAIAIKIQGRSGIQCLAAATDGSDGPTGDAGALVDGETVKRGEQEGLDAVSCLHCTDSGQFLEASGDLVQTGPSGTNVTDIIIILKEQNH